MTIARTGRVIGFTSAAFLAAALAVASAWWLAQPPRNLDLYSRLGMEIGCTCGGCPNLPIATCGCGFADGMLADLRRHVDGGMDPERIRTAFVADYGPATRILPPTPGSDSRPGPRR